MNTKKLLLALMFFTVIIATPLLASAEPNDEVKLMIIELKDRENGKPVNEAAIPSEDDSISNPHYETIGIYWYTTANYWINPSNKDSLSSTKVISALKNSAQSWDEKTSRDVFNYKGSTSRTAGKRDGYNVVSWGNYRGGVIAVTYIWYIDNQIIETDTQMNTRYKWSLTGEPGKMDVQNIMTHEFGHWAGLNDLYNDIDYWLTMYGYANYGETYKRSLGLGDIKGVKAVYGT